jgi:hypothetical protein
MLKIILLVLFVLVIAAAFAVLKLKAAGGPKRGVYYLRKTIFTAAERSFLGVLDRALPPGVTFFGKVRLADIFGVQSGLDPSTRQAARNRIDRKHVDFLLVRIDDLAPLAGIELDDRSHEEDERQQRDAFVDEVFSGAGLPLLHVPAQKMYDLPDLKAKVASLLAPPRGA